MELRDEMEKLLCDCDEGKCFRNDCYDADCNECLIKNIIAKVKEMIQEYYQQAHEAHQISLNEALDKDRHAYYRGQIHLCHTILKELK